MYDVDDLSLKYCFEKAAELAYASTRAAIRILYTQKLMAATWQAALKLVSPQGLDQRRLQVLLEADVAPGNVADELFTGQRLSTIFSWVLIRRALAPDEALAKEMSRYLTRHRDVPERLPYQVIISIYRDRLERRFVATLGPPVPGESDLKFLME